MPVSKHRKKHKVKSKKRSERIKKAKDNYNNLVNQYVKQLNEPKEESPYKVDLSPLNPQIILP